MTIIIFILRSISLVQGLTPGFGKAAGGRKVGLQAKDYRTAG